MPEVIINSKPCYLILTKNAIKNAETLFNEHFPMIPGDEILKRILFSEMTFLVHIERDRSYNEEEVCMNIIFDMNLYRDWHFKNENQTLNLKGVLKRDCFLLTNIYLVPSILGTSNNRRLSTNLHFFFETSPVPFPKDILEKVTNLPISIERSRILNQRLKSWEIYLDLMKKNAEKNEASLNYNSMVISKNLNYLIIHCPQLKQFILYEGLERNLRKAFVFLLDEDGIEADKIGIVNRFLFDTDEIEIELDEDYEEYIRQNKWSPPEKGKVRLNNFGDIAQVNALRNGFIQLKNGKALNPNLEYILFDEEPLRSTSSNGMEFNFQEAIQNNLNDFQRQAVQGALAAEDLFLIQGPPGTGKTTVIAEICYQNAERGLKTLVASQSNLAVDNALSKLLAHPKIRILRKGRTESIEEEGKKFIEENIAITWKQQTELNVKNDLNQLNKEIYKTLDKINKCKNDIKINQTKIKNYEDSKAKIAEINKLEINKNYLESQLQNLLTEKIYIEKQITDNQKQSIVYQQQIEELSKAKTNGTLLKEWQLKKDQLENNKETERMYINNYSLISEYNQLKTTLDTKDANLKLLKKKQEKLKNISLIDYSQDYIKLIPYLKKQKFIFPQSLHKIELQINTLKNTLENKTTNLTLIVDESQRKKDLLIKIKSLILEQELILIENDYDIEPLKIFQTNYYGSYEDMISDYDKMLKRTKNISKPEQFLNNLFKIFEFDSLLVKQTISNYKKASSIRDNLQHDINHLEARVKNLNYEAFTNTTLNQIDLLNKEFKEKFKVHLKKEMHDNDSLILQDEQEFEKIKIDLDNLSIKYQAIILKQPKATLNELKARLNKIEKELQLLGTAEDYINRNDGLIQNYHDLIKLNQDDKLTLSENYQNNLTKNNNLTIQFQIINQKYNEIKEVFPHLVGVNIQEDIHSLRFENSTLNKQIQLFENSIEEKQTQKLIQEEWLDLLINAKEHDLNEVKKLYIKHANVIGITCVQSARRDFTEEYPNFDVVIIDEVSKATPPELLLPMLKGKKIILVGDQHQLPPMIGLDSLEEFIESNEDSFSLKEIEEILQESVFERLFKSVENESKTTLRIQYRMHEDIMNNITQFYVEDNNSIGLICGINNSNLERDHHLSGNYIQRGQHVMWFDTPHESEFFEQQDLGSTSIYNEKEIEIIGKLLLDINEATALAKSEGRIPLETNKQVGLISFYSEQVRMLKELVQTMELPHIDYRIGTVDRFQGMEKEVVIASFVRNHKNPRKDIGFSNNYRRLNVALSRAQELMIVVGSAKMFTQQAKRDESKKIYSRVVENIRVLNGMRDYMGRVK